MADNVTANAGSGGAVFATALGSWSGDSANFPGCFTAIVSGSEGAWTITNVVGGAGAVTAGVQRMTLASDDPAVVALQVLDNAISGSEMQVDVVGALPAGTNAIGKLAANSGVDIGDVDITSVVPGTGATSLGKAEDAAHTSADTGVFILSVRSDTAASTAGTDGDYAALTTDSTGRLHVNVGNTVTVASHAVTNAGTFAVQATQSGTWTVTGTGGTFPVTDSGGSLTTDTAGDVTHDAADSGNPLKIGAKATTALSGVTLVANADRTDLYAGIDGVQLVRPHTGLEDIVQERTTNTDGASTAFASGLAAPGAGVRLYVKNVTISNSSASFCTVDLRDGAAGSVLWTLPVPATGGVTMNFDPPLKLSANTALAFDASAATTTLSISANGFKSKV